MKTGVLTAKELKSYLGSPAVYISAAVFLILSGASFVTYLSALNYSDTSIRGFIEAAQFLMLLIAAILSMRVITEEKKTGTWELILTSPITDLEIVIAKFTAGLAVLSCILAVSFYFPILLLVFGDPDLGPIVSGYMGLFLLGCAAMAIGIFASSVTSSQIIAAVLSTGILFGLWFLGMAGTIIRPPIGNLISYLSLSDHFTDFTRGIIDTKHIVYYLSVTGIFLYLSVRSIEMGRWR